MSNELEKQESEEVIEVIDKIEKLKPEQQEQVITTMEMYHGPIPHPDILAGYDKLDEGAARKIIDNGIGESDHRRKMESRIVKHNARNFYFRYVLAFIIAIVFGFGSFYLILNGHPIIGSIFGGVTFLSMIGTFTGNNNQEPKNKGNNDESENMPEKK